MTSPTSDRRFGLVGNTPIKAAVDCATTGNITLSGEQVIDGFQTGSSRVLVGHQTDATQNGIYDSSSAAWTRSADADGNYDLATNTLVAVNRGSQAGAFFGLTTLNPITIGVSALTWVLSSGYTLGLSLISSVGSSLVGFIGRMVGMIARTLQEKVRETRSVLDFGALGNCNGSTGNGHDDTAAIIAADAALAAGGGGTLRFPWTGLGGYRITAVVRRSANVTWEFEGIQGFPFASGALTNCLWADFSIANQWVVDTNTLIGGLPIAYNTILTTFPTATATYNSGLVNCYIRVPSGNAIVPFGGIRSAGAGNDRVVNCSVTGCGTGLFVNESIGGFYECHSVTPYYGTVAWNDCNANTFRAYATQGTTNPTTVPAGYQLPFMTALNGGLTGAPYRLSTNNHYLTPFGLVIGASNGGYSVSNVVELTMEAFTGGVFHLNARSTVFTRTYLEGSAGQVAFGFVAAASTFEARGLHAFLTGTGTLFDFGASLSGCQITSNGVNSYATFGAGPYPDGSLVQIAGFTSSQMSYTGTGITAQFLSDNPGFTAPTFAGAWANVGAPFANAGYRKNQFSGDVELCGFITTGATGTTAFTLPAGYRPFFKRAFIAYGSGSGTFPNVLIDTAGVVTPSYAGTAGTNICLDGITFKAEQ